MMKPAKTSTRRWLVTKGMGDQPVPGNLTVEIDWEKFAYVMGRKAAANSTRKTRLDCGIVVKWKPE
jgi:hypothetical protein